MRQVVNDKGHLGETLDAWAVIVFLPAESYARYKLLFDKYNSDKLPKMFVQ